MAERYFLRFLVRNQPKDVIFEVRRNEADRLQSILDEADQPYTSGHFFWFDTVDGLAVILNLADIQAVRFLWDPAEAPPDSTRSDSKIRIQLRGRSAVLEEYTDHADELYDLFVNLEHGPEVVAFPRFMDEDGEPLQLNAQEVVWITAPAHTVQEGKRMVEEQDGLGNDA